MSFESFPGQEEAKRLLGAALADGPAHAYLFHGPPGVGKRRAAIAFAGELIGRAPGLDADEIAAIARLAGGRLDRAERLLDPDARRRRETLLSVARNVYADEFDAGEAARALLEGIRERGAAAKTEAEEV